MLIGVVMVYKGEVDGMICGMISNMVVYLCYIDQILGGINCVYVVMNGLVLLGCQVFLIDMYVNVDLMVEELVEIIIMVVEELCCFGIKFKVVLMLYLNFGLFEVFLVVKMCEVLVILCECVLNLEVDGEMYGDVVFDQKLCDLLVLDLIFKGEVNLLVMLNIDVVNIVYNLLKMVVGNNIVIGLILLGVKKLVYIFMLLVIV